MSKIEEALRKAREMQVAGARDPSLPETESRSPVAETIARMRDPRLRSAAELIELGMIHPAMADTRVRDIFRNLRTSVLQRSAGDNAVVLVTSTVPEGGGSFVARNLAAAIAFDQNRTALLVDCNLGKPAQDMLCLTEGARGLTDYLHDADLGVENIIHATGIPRLRVIPIGQNREPGTEYFALFRMQRLLRELKQRYRERYIVVDAPSVGISADARMLAELCDQALLVVPWASSTDSQVEAAVQALGEERLLGTLINDEPSSALAGRWRR